MPNFSNLTNGLVVSQIKICPNYLFNPDPKVYELSSGLVLAKNFVPDELAIRLTECCLFDFPRRDDAKTNVAKIGKDVEKCIKSFQANSTLAKVDLFGLRWELNEKSTCLDNCGCIRTHNCVCIIACYANLCCQLTDAQNFMKMPENCTQKYATEIIRLPFKLKTMPRTWSFVDGRHWVIITTGTLENILTLRGTLEKCQNSSSASVVQSQNVLHFRSRFRQRRQFAITIQQTWVRLGFIETIQNTVPTLLFPSRSACLRFFCWARESEMILVTSCFSNTATC